MTRQKEERTRKSSNKASKTSSVPPITNCSLVTLIQMQTSLDSAHPPWVGAGLRHATNFPSRSNGQKANKMGNKEESPSQSKTTEGLHVVEHWAQVQVRCLAVSFFFRVVYHGHQFVILLCDGLAAGQDPCFFRNSTQVGCLLGKMIYWQR